MTAYLGFVNFDSVEDILHAKWDIYKVKTIHTCESECEQICLSQ